MDFVANIRIHWTDHLAKKTGSTTWVPDVEVMVVDHKGTIIGVEVPFFAELEIAMTDPGVRGDTASGGSKPATLETGAVIQVPFFINIGDRVKVDTRSGDYITRV